MDRYSVVFITVPKGKDAQRVSRALVREKLAACVNIISGVNSFFWWQGKIDSAKEDLLVIKTRKGLFKKVCALIERIHPYDTPEVIAIALENIIPKYRRWLDASMRKSS